MKITDTIIYLQEILDILLDGYIEIGTLIESNNTIDKAKLESIVDSMFSKAEEYQKQFKS